jgi:hypothetical protein
LLAQELEKQLLVQTLVLQPELVLEQQREPQALARVHAAVNSWLQVSALLAQQVQLSVPVKEFQKLRTRLKFYLVVIQY